MKDFRGNEITPDILGNPLKREKDLQQKRGTLYTIDKDTVLEKQKGLCAGKNCKRLHNGKRMPVYNRSNFDHIVALGLNGKNDISNLQALCANCHQLKTREDRKHIAQKKQEERKSSKKGSGYISPGSSINEKIKQILG